LIEEDHGRLFAVDVFNDQQRILAEVLPKDRL
jgi:hypothetical protein